MKLTFAATAIAALTLAAGAALAPATAHAEPMLAPAGTTYLQYAPPVPVKMYCNVNGVVYPVDYYNRIWSYNDFGPLVIGVILFTPDGTIGVSGGVRYPAFC